MSAWVKQIASQVTKYGADRAAWYCEWNEPDGSRRIKSCGRGAKGKRAAELMAKHVAAELLTGKYNWTKAVGWTEFRERYENKILASLAVSTQIGVAISLDHLERLLPVKGKPLTYLTAERIRAFVVERKKDRGAKPGDVVSPATVNRDLRHIRSVLNVAVEWGYLTASPGIRFEREPRKLPRYVTPEHFAAMYDSCDAAKLPEGLHVAAAAWWRAILVFLQMTGWRIGEILSLEWSDVNLDAGTAITRAAVNKGKRDSVVGLHPVVVDHLRPLKAFHSKVFPWELERGPLYREFASIQAAAGIDLPCSISRMTAADIRGRQRQETRDGHACTAACHRYGFHDLRRAFATMNAANMSREALQALMRHQSSLTTERYINFARQMKPAVANLHVPDILRMGSSGQVGTG
jgi:integrase